MNVVDTIRVFMGKKTPQPPTPHHPQPIPKDNPSLNWPGKMESPLQSPYASKSVAAYSTKTMVTTTCGFWR